MDIFYPTQPRAPPFRGIFGAADHQRAVRAPPEMKRVSGFGHGPERTHTGPAIVWRADTAWRIIPRGRLLLRRVQESPFVAAGVSAGQHEGQCLFTRPAAPRSCSITTQEPN